MKILLAIILENSLKLNLLSILSNNLKNKYNKDKFFISNIRYFNKLIEPTYILHKSYKINIYTL